MTDVTRDLATVTCLSYTAVQAILDKIPYLISHAVCEAVVAGEDVADVDLGFGVFSISIGDDEVRTKFIPSRKMEALIKEATETDSSPLIGALEESLRNKIKNSYKTLF